MEEGQKATMDSLLLFDTSNNLEARAKLLSEIIPKEKYYSRIRQIATEEHNNLAVVALSKFRKQQDKHLIEQMLTDRNNQVYGLAAVINFPDASFFPILQQTLRNEITEKNSNDDNRLQLLYKAIVQYKDQQSRHLLQSVLSEMKAMQSNYHLVYLQQALKMYPAAIYEGLPKPIHSSSPTEKSGI